MSQDRFRCQNCGYTPSKSPVSGAWYCPKCGKRTNIPKNRPHVAKKWYRSAPIKKTVSRDQVMSRIYHNLASRTSPDLGLKERYLNPSLPPIEPKERKKIRLFIKKNDLH